jgi:dihydroorotate dehydrogenase (NAD+) catalytic subunit
MTAAPIDIAEGERPSLATHCGRIDFRNPVLTASGTFGYGKEFEELVPLSSLGGLVTKGISPNPRFGNPSPRICETASGMLNSIGLENVGVDGFVTGKLPFLRTCGTKVLVNFFGTTFDEYIDCGERLGKLDGVDGLEMNVSCPNIKAGGIEFGRDPQVLGDLIRACRKVIAKPLMGQIDAEYFGHPRAGPRVRGKRRRCGFRHQHRHWNGHRRDARRRPRLATIFGGLSGPAIKPIALRMVYQIHRAGLGIPICGIGGIQTGLDAVEFFLAGASAIQVGTQNFIDPCFRRADRSRGGGILPAERGFRSARAYRSFETQAMSARLYPKFAGAKYAGNLPAVVFMRPSHEDD